MRRTKQSNDKKNHTNWIKSVYYFFDIWSVILLSLLGNYIISIQFIWGGNFDWNKVIALSFLAISIILYVVFYFSFKEVYMSSERSHQEDFQKYLNGKCTDWNGINYYFSKRFDKGKYLLFVFSLILLIGFLFVKD